MGWWFYLQVVRTPNHYLLSSNFFSSQVVGTLKPGVKRLWSPAPSPPPRQATWWNFYYLIFLIEAMSPAIFFHSWSQFFLYQGKWFTKRCRCPLSTTTCPVPGLVRGNLQQYVPERNSSCSRHKLLMLQIEAAHVPDRNSSYYPLGLDLRSSLVLNRETNNDVPLQKCIPQGYK